MKRKSSELQKLQEKLASIEAGQAVRMKELEIKVADFKEKDVIFKAQKKVFSEETYEIDGAISAFLIERATEIRKELYQLWEEGLINEKAGIETPYHIDVACDEIEGRLGEYTISHIEIEMRRLNTEIARRIRDSVRNLLCQKLYWEVNIRDDYDGGADLIMHFLDKNGKVI